MITDSQVLLDEPEGYEACTTGNMSQHCCSSVEWTAAILSQYSGIHLCAASKVGEQPVQTKLQLILILAHKVVN
jgi:hypothetical protein